MYLLCATTSISWLPHAIQPHQRMLFFAEIWGLNSSAKQSDDPVPRNANLHCKELCCPLPDYKTYHTYLGRCYLCEPDLSKIVHPPSGNHQGADCAKIEGLLDYMCEPRRTLHLPVVDTFMRL